MDGKFFTICELATRWNASYKSVRYMLYRGKLKGFKAGREWRIAASAVEAYEAGK